MNPAAILYLGQLMQLLTQVPALIQAGQNVAGIIGNATTAIRSMVAENRGPTAEEWAALDAQTTSLRAQLHTP